MLTPIQLHIAMQDQKRQLLQAARLHQLYSQAEQEREHMSDRMMTLLGDLMIAGGEKLKARSAIPCALEPEQG